MKLIKRIKLAWLLPAIIILWALIGPLPSDNQNWQKASYGVKTIQRLDKIQPKGSTGNLQVSFAKEDISTDIGQPIMGYTDRKPLASEGVLDACYVRALSLRVGSEEVTVISADTMILFEDIVDEVVRRSGIERSALYFNATHTHSGPGGWAKGNIKEFFYGKYEQKYYEKLVSKIVAAINNSRQNYRPAEVGFLQVSAPEWIENRIYPERPANPNLSALVFKEPGKDEILAAITSYSAHGTVVRRETHKCSADYGGQLCAALAQKVEFPMFLSGAMGDARPKASGEEGALKMGGALADKLIAQLSAVEYKNSVELASLYLPVDVPSSRFALTARWELFPFFMRYFQPQTTGISVLRVGSNVLVGWPADSAGELAAPLSEWGESATGEKLNIILTSFNGSWRGYATTYDTYMNKDSYATRMMGFMGPWYGEYLLALSKGLILKTDKGE